MSNLVSLIIGKLSGIAANEIIIFVISLLPILELRGGMLAASFLKVPYIRALVICIIGNLLPIPFILLFIRKILELMEKWEPTKKIALWLKNKADSKKDSIEKYGFWGLVLFVGIPLPGTGAWTGSLIASLLYMDIKKSFLAVVIGVLIAAAIMSLISYGLLPQLF